MRTLTRKYQISPVAAFVETEKGKAAMKGCSGKDCKGIVAALTDYHEWLEKMATAPGTKEEPATGCLTCGYKRRARGEKGGDK